MKIKQIFLFLTLVIFASSCALKKKAYKNTDNIAIISINSLDQVKNNSSLQARLVSDINLPDTVLTEPGNKVHDHFFKQRSSLVDKVINEDEILNSPEFQEFVSEYNASIDKEFRSVDKLLYMGGEFVAADGYPVMKRGDDAVLNSFNYLPERVDAVLILSNTFQFFEEANVQVMGISSAGFHKQKVQAVITVYLVNREGKKIFFASFMGESEGKIGKNAEDNKYSLDELADQALAEAVTKMREYLVKKVGS